MKKMLQRFSTALMILALLCSLLAGCGSPAEGGSSAAWGSDGSGSAFWAEDSGSGASASAVDELPEESPLPEDGSYTTVADVAAYLAYYGRLPENFLTKKEARALGWEGGSLEPYAPGMCIGGDRFGNYEGILPEGNYHECDIDTLGVEYRGSKRLVYSEDGRIYYTEDHYESFLLLYGEED